METINAGASPLYPHVLRWPFTSSPNQIYFTTRLAALAGVVAELVGFNMSTQYDCQRWFQFVLVRAPSPSPFHSTASGAYEALR